MRYTFFWRDDPFFSYYEPATSGLFPHLSARVNRKAVLWLFMRSVYEAASGLDAHMILSLLEQQRIPGRIEGEYLQGGVGELQAMGLVRVLVSEADYADARKIINEWESIQPASDSSKPETRPSRGLMIFVIGAVAGAWIMYWILKWRH